MEREEEASSPGLRNIIASNEDLLKADVWFICDGPAHASRKQKLYFGVCGVAGLDLTVYGANSNLHSGHYGNWSPNPAMILAQLLASMKDDRGRVLVDGFYEVQMYVLLPFIFLILKNRVARERCLRCGRSPS